MSTETRFYEKDGVMIFERDQLDDLEIKVFNPHYLSMIGFPDAEVKLVNKALVNKVNDNLSNPILSQTNTVENENVEKPALQENKEELAKTDGGYYDNVDELTVPFRYFAYFVQSKRDFKPIENKSSAPKRSFYSMLFSSRDTPTSTDVVKKENTGLKWFYDNIKHAFNVTKKETEVVSNVKESVDELAVNEPVNELDVKEPIAVDLDSVQVNAEETPKPEPPAFMWVVKIPIVNDVEELGSYAKDERVLNSRIHETKVNKENGIVVEGEYKSVGNREYKMVKAIRTCEPCVDSVVMDEANENIILPGTKMSKYKKLEEKDE